MGFKQKSKKFTFVLCITIHFKQYTAISDLLSFSKFCQPEVKLDPFRSFQGNSSFPNFELLLWQLALSSLAVFLSFVPPLTPTHTPCYPPKSCQNSYVCVLATYVLEYLRTNSIFVHSKFEFPHVIEEFLCTTCISMCFILLKSFMEHYILLKLSI